MATNDIPTSPDGNQVNLTQSINPDEENAPAVQQEIINAPQQPKQKPRVTKSGFNIDKAIELVEKFVLSALTHTPGFAAALFAGKLYSDVKKAENQKDVNMESVQNATRALIKAITDEVVANLSRDATTQVKNSVDKVLLDIERSATEVTHYQSSFDKLADAIRNATETDRELDQSEIDRIAGQIINLPSLPEVSISQIANDAATAKTNSIIYQNSTKALTQGFNRIVGDKSVSGGEIGQLLNLTAPPEVAVIVNASIDYPQINISTPHIPEIGLRVTPPAITPDYGAIGAAVGIFAGATILIKIGQVLRSDVRKKRKNQDSDRNGREAVPMQYLNIQHVHGQTPYATGAIAVAPVTNSAGPQILSREGLLALNTGDGIEIEIGQRQADSRFLLHLPSDGDDLPPSNKMSLQDLVGLGDGELRPKHIYPTQKLKLRPDNILCISKAREVPVQSVSRTGSRAGTGRHTRGRY